MRTYSLFGVEPVSSVRVTVESEISNYVKYQIQKDNYVILSLNKYYISMAKEYDKYNHNALYMLFGYDNDIFDIAGLFDGIYSQRPISKNELNDSYKYYTESLRNDGLKINLLKANNYVNYNTSSYILKTNISDFQNSLTQIYERVFYQATIFTSVVSG